ncbi:hypothetical protein FOC4_g10014076 [Fusarium odoratissimum]|uniref:Uncharacterized protein n=1 Tax=Fusarium oxysporum f. sp. cubense (strain race 4) TaxID=2502994 RepID=N1R7Y8_FUSC4|nr:hypothetical protein FOC4_g10014076 [Fusarium odoratissimum]
MDQPQPPERGTTTDVSFESGQRKNFLDAINRRLQWLDKLGVLKVRMRAGDDGLPTYDGMPEEPVDERKTTHVVWRKLSDELYRMLTAEIKPTATEVLSKLNLARTKYMKDFELIDAFREKLSNPATAQGLVEDSILSWCPQAMARIIRYDASTLSDPDWWNRNADEVGGYNMSSSSLIRVVISEMDYARAAESNDRLFLYPELAAEVLRMFVSCQANGPLLNALDHQIEGLEAYIRSNTQEERLEQELQ